MGMLWHGANMEYQRVVLVGRPNVGKSTLFNRLVGKRIALVHDKPGVTRDRREGIAHLSDLTFIVVDTAGLVDIPENQLDENIREQTRKAIKEADVLCFMIDGRHDLTPLDKDLARLLRQQNKPVIVIINKCEGNKDFAGLIEAHTLSFPTLVPLSAEHGEGLVGLFEALAPYIEAAPQQHRDNDPLQLAIIGRPNVGKSTLMNRLLGEDRVLTGETPGTTRDSIQSLWTFQGRSIHLVDTAGVRRQSKITDPIEKLAVQDTSRVLRFADVAILVVDSLAPLEKQDLTLASTIIEEGRALIIAVNKIDLISKPNLFLRDIKRHLENHLAQVAGIFCIGISAKTGQYCSALMRTVLKAEHLWNRRLSTAVLNRWLNDVTEIHPPPLIQGRRIRLKYMTQIKTRPPTFVIFATQALDLPDSYSRYLMNSLREHFNWPGTPLRLTFRSIKNPYASESH